jgi:16S rRNA (guanine966-N2)-methyltransferase
MTRIIAGYAGSRRLAVPRTGTRPTSDQVREAIFSALAARDVISGAAVLDLYAGTGALGLEAASRGASRVLLVENNAQAAKVARQNIGIVSIGAPKPAPRLDVTSQSVMAYLAVGIEKFDLVFLDPPYDLAADELAQTLAALVPRLNPDAVVLLERGSRSPAPELPTGLELDRRKDYGDTTLWWLSPSELELTDDEGDQPELPSQSA